MNDTKSLEGVEIFAAGTWNGDEYTDQDLDGIVAAFAETKDALKPYIKLGHSKAQALLKADELPAAGWIERVYKVGSKLLADIRDVPEKIYDLIKARAYARVSSELFVDTEVADKKYPYLLKAVAFLGGATPAVQNLDDIHALYIVGAEVRAYENGADTRTYEFDAAKPQEGREMAEKKPAEGSAAEEKAETPAAQAAEAAAGGDKQCAKCMEYDAHLKQRTKERDGLQKTLDGMAPTLKENKEKAEALTVELASEKQARTKSDAELKRIYAEKRSGEIKVKVAAFVQDKRILPSQADALTTLLEASDPSSERKFKLGDKEIQSEEALILEFISLGGAALPTEGKTESGKSSAVPDPEDAQAVDAKVKEFMQKNGEKVYTKAYVAVIKELREARAKDAESKK